ncbi:GW dipeptide domain-containing protein [Lacticaseibacillus suibinensis]|uniref:GW dipeptide domain-containing protein n=1 Tax=Lacticaseibacillus suibinensis TaxID=2486011 RepID=UPI00194384D6|nr:GW dipeptide domain-containing protein [Lacticaseibacillus suibinensis]
MSKHKNNHKLQVLIGGSIAATVLVVGSQLPQHHVGAAAASDSATATPAATNSGRDVISATNMHSNYTSPLNPMGTDSPNYQFEAADIDDSGSTAEVHNMQMPNTIPSVLAAQWQVYAKQVGAEDAKKTGRQQKITMVAAEPAVDSIPIGNALYPRVDTIDVASYQAWLTQADFNRLKALGVKTVIVKLTEGSGYVNPAAAQQISRAQAAGLRIAVYHFATYNSPAGAAAEAAHFAGEAKALGLPASTPVVADIETNDYLGGDVAGGLRSFWAQMSASGYQNHVVYTGLYYPYSAGVIATVGNSKAWIAQYPYSPRATSLNHTQYGAWQFSSNAYIPGGSTAGRLDVSIDYKGIFTGITYDAITAKASLDMTGKITGSGNTGLFSGGPYYTSEASASIADYARNYTGQTVTITGKATTKRAEWLQIKLANGKVFWIDRAAVAVNYDPVLSDTKESYGATLAGNRNDGLFTGGPYLTNQASETVAASASTLSGQMFKVIRQQQTARATWVEIQLASGATHWINKAGVTPIQFDAVTEQKATDEVEMISENGRGDALFTGGPYLSNVDSMFSADSAEKYDGQLVHLVQTATTAKARWGQIVLQSGQTFWINLEALKKAPLDNVTAENTDIYQATIDEGDRNDGLFAGGPYNTNWESLKAAGSAKDFDGQAVTVLGTKTTSRAQWAHIKLANGKDFWVNSVAVKKGSSNGYDAITQQASLSGVGLIKGTQSADGLFAGGPYDTSAATKVPALPAMKYEGQYVTLLARATTVKAKWVQVRLADGKEYWLNADRVQIQTSDPVLTSYDNQSVSAVISDGNRNDGMFVGGAYHTVASSFVVAASASQYEGQSVTIRAVQQTARALWVEVQMRDGKTYWVTAAALAKNGQYDLVLGQKSNLGAGTITNPTANDGLFVGGPYATSAESSVVAAPASTLSGQYVTVIGNAMTTRSEWTQIKTSGGKTYWIASRLIKPVGA